LLNDFYNKNWLGNMENIQSLLMVVVHGIYPQACKFLNMNHHLHSSFYDEKSMIERAIQSTSKG
jgi:hypothetical protein